jgi:hypothetical protein
MRPTAVGLVLFLAATSLYAATPDFTGHWRVDDAKSDDAHKRIDEGAGPGQVKNAGRTRLIASSGQTKEVDRVALRDQLLALAGDTRDMEIAQTAAELKISTSEQVRVHYFGREHSRESLAGQALKCTLSWKGEQLLIDQRGAEGLHVMELLTLLPGGHELIHVVRFEHSLLVKPFEIKRVYTRASAD